MQLPALIRPQRHSLLTLDWTFAATLIAGIGLAAGAGALVAVMDPTAAVFLAVLLGCLLALFVLVPRMRSPFSVVSIALVGGYITLTRGFSGLMLPLPGQPLYIGELALALLLVPALFKLRRQALGTPVLLLIVWMVYNAALTVQDIPTFGIDAVRDAATWYYGLYTFVGVAVWITLGASNLRRQMVPVFLIGLLAAPIGIGETLNLLPSVQLPISDTSLFTAKHDTIGMHLLGAALFFLTGQHLAATPRLRWLTPAVVAVAIAYVLIVQNRATFLGLVGVFLVLLVYRRWRPMLWIAVICSSIVIFATAADVTVNLGYKTVSARAVMARELSPLDFITGSSNSATSAAEDPNNAGTIYWRVIWWRALWQQATDDPRVMFFGQGYGADLRAPLVGLSSGALNWDQGEDQGRPVRSPHNVVMTLLARSGLVGLGLWLALLGTTFAQMVRATMACRRDGDQTQELLGVWLLAELALILTVAVFGIVLEAPHGAIPFFFFLGVALAWSAERLHLASARRPYARDGRALAQPGRSRPLAANPS